MNHTRRKPPPYAKQFSPFQFDSVTGKIESKVAFVYFGSKAWEAKDKLGSHCVILPNNEPSQQYDWSFLSGYAVIGCCLGDSEPIYRRRLAAELLVAGVLSVDIFMQSELSIKTENQLSLPIQQHDDPLELFKPFPYLILSTPHERYRR